jgi:hypothetical protein
MFKQENEYIEVDEDRSTLAPPSERIKSEPPMFQSSQDNPIIINEDPSFEDNSDVEFIEARFRTKKEPFDNIIVDMTMVRPNPSLQCPKAARTIRLSSTKTHHSRITRTSSLLKRVSGRRKSLLTTLLLT